MLWNLVAERLAASQGALRSMELLITYKAIGGSRHLLVNQKLFNQHLGTSLNYTKKTITLSSAANAYIMTICDFTKRRKFKVVAKLQTSFMNCL
jgi:hypothetical protein